MATLQEGMEQPLNRKSAQSLYSKYMNLALDSRTTGDRVLFEKYYQCAEYYLHCMNELAASPGKSPSTPKPLFRDSYLGRNRRRRQA